MSTELLQHQSFEVSQRKANYGLAYLQAVCYQAGIPVRPTPQDQDVNGVDCWVEFPEGPVFVQVKCTGRQLGTRSGTLSYDIGETVFTKWKRSRLPVYLVVVIVPNEIDGAWDDFSVDDSTLLNSAAYWSLIDRGKDSGPWSVQIERANRLTPDTLVEWYSDSIIGGFGGHV
jgi:hypothetical protein